MRSKVAAERPVAEKAPTRAQRSTHDGTCAQAKEVREPILAVMRVVSNSSHRVVRSARRRRDSGCAIRASTARAM
ncbi:hypothetical protein HMPREF0004_2861 [Achromobacter piechaudii ATCC 43553]|uniref:Uncharacterized protein n=1 Tax=Achromobacter piechaudii ATCC 43553 TaxID=742159 RepID=D4XBL4_9BURK|nr:hypothetical protein HMPREF0004_2861 [Achromobacter piechaudii ATCC 43553]